MGFTRRQRPLRRFFNRLASTGASRRRDERLKEEVEEHLALLAEEYVRAGMPPIEARRKAILKFGAIEAVQESYSAEGRLLFVESLLQDLRYALRMFANSPEFPVLAATSLALAIGANTRIFSFAKQAL